MSKYADSRNNPINIGDKVRWRGGIYTIKKFFPKEGRMDTARIEFMEEVPEDKLSLGSPDEISVDIYNGVDWCMCTELLEVARDGFSTCSVCGGRDAYGGSSERPESKRKKIVSEEEVTCNGDLNAAHIHRITAEVRHAWEDMPHASWDINEAGFKAIELFRDVLLARL